MSITTDIETARSYVSKYGLCRTVRHVRSILLSRLHIKLRDRRQDGFEAIPTGPGRAPNLDPVIGPNGALSTGYAATPRAVIHWILDGLVVAHRELNFIDIGSGRGRVVLSAAQYPFKAVWGIEFVPALSAEAEKNLKIMPKSRIVAKTVQLINDDALAVDLPDGESIYYMFNPCSNELMTRIVDRIKSHLGKMRSVGIFVFVNFSKYELEMPVRDMSIMDLKYASRIAIFCFSPYSVRIYKYSGQQ